MLSELNREMLKAILPAFVAEGVTQVFTAECCGRVLVSKTRPVKCSTCNAECASEAISTNDYVARHD